MFSMKRMDAQADLMGRMAERSGADLGEALASGLIDGQGLRTAYLKCYGCDEGAACRAVLEAGDAAPPAFCRNAGLLRDLRG